MKPPPPMADEPAAASLVLVRPLGRGLEIILNRPQALNSLTLEMVRLLQAGLDLARQEERLGFVLLRGEGERGFCAGGDLKTLYQAVQSGKPELADRFFQEEYALDLCLHEFPKPVVVLADGVTMGGGLGLAAGADLVIVTERTRLGLPETRIGFFPDVGATGWLFSKCPSGYPEFLALTGYEIQGPECVRLGLATDYAASANLARIRAALGRFSLPLPPHRRAGARLLRRELGVLLERPPQANCGLDSWVQAHFQGRATMAEIVASLSTCNLESLYCREVFTRLAERSPTALALTLLLLRRHEGQPLAQVFAGEARAAAFMIRHPDYAEGIRARLLDRDDRPRWSPASLEEVGPLPVET